MNPFVSACMQVCIPVCMMGCHLAWPIEYKAVRHAGDLLCRTHIPPPSFPLACVPWFMSGCVFGCLAAIMSSLLGAFMSVSSFTVLPPSSPGLMPSLVWSIVAGTTPLNRVLVIGSPKGGSGKTSLTTFAASELARLGARVLLVEATEGQAPLTQAFAFSDADTGAGLGLHLQRIIGMTKDGENFAQTVARLRPMAAAEAKIAVTSIRRISVSPNDPAIGFDFLSCGEGNLAEVATSPKMAQRPIRRAMFATFLEALANEHGGWDFIFIDILPSAESPIVKGSMGVADAYALVVDTESAQPLPGWGVLMEEIVRIQQAREGEGKDPNIFKGIILNKINPTRPNYTQKINRLKIRVKQRQAMDSGVTVPILAEIRKLTSLALLGFNVHAVQLLAEAYGGKIPEDLDDLTDQDVERLVLFEEGIRPDGSPLPVAAGIGWLSNLLPGSRKTLMEEAHVLHPMLLSLAGDGNALAALEEVMFPTATTAPA